MVNVHYGLAEGTSVHWHGMRLPAAMDGGPHQPIRSGADWSPQWRVDQPAATLWYHPHPRGVTARHAYRGLAGMFIVDDPESAGLDLPSTYGVDDIPVLVQDLKLHGDGQLDDRPGLLGGIGVLGDTVAVNGTVAPCLEVTAERLRLRLVIGSMARAYDFGSPTAGRSRWSAPTPIRTPRTCTTATWCSTRTAAARTGPATRTGRRRP